MCKRVRTPRFIAPARASAGCAWRAIGSPLAEVLVVGTLLIPRADPLPGIELREIQVAVQQPFAYKETEIVHSRRRQSLPQILRHRPVWIVHHAEAPESWNPAQTIQQKAHLGVEVGGAAAADDPGVGIGQEEVVAPGDPLLANHPIGVDARRIRILQGVAHPAESACEVEMIVQPPARSLVRTRSSFPGPGVQGGTAGLIEYDYAKEVFRVLGHGVAVRSEQWLPLAAQIDPFAVFAAGLPQHVVVPGV